MNKQEEVLKTYKDTLGKYQNKLNNMLEDTIEEIENVPLTKKEIELFSNKQTEHLSKLELISDEYTKDLINVINLVYETDK